MLMANAFPQMMHALTNRFKRMTTELRGRFDHRSCLLSLQRKSKRLEWELCISLEQARSAASVTMEVSMQFCKLTLVFIIGCTDTHRDEDPVPLEEKQ